MHKIYECERYEHMFNEMQSMMRSGAIPEDSDIVLMGALNQLCMSHFYRDMWDWYRKMHRTEDVEHYDPSEHHNKKEKRVTQNGEHAHLTEEEYMDWVAGMKNQDGTTGAHWSIAETTAVGQQIGLDFSVMSRECWYTALNKAYSDHYNTAKRYNAHTTPEFFISLVKDEMGDADSIPLAERLYVYYHDISK